MKTNLKWLTPLVSSAIAPSMLLMGGCSPSPPPAAPSPNATVAVTPPTPSPPVVAPLPVQPAPVQPPPATAPAATANTAPAKAAITNAHPDLVTFGFLWNPRGPYDADYQAADRPKLSPQDNDALITKVLTELDTAADDPARQERALLELTKANRDEARRAEVSERLEKLLGSPSLRVQILATQACATWGTQTNLATLKELAAQDDPHFSNDAIWAIYYTSSDIGQVAPFLALPICHHGAQQCFLKHRAGEEHVWPLLSSADAKVVFNALGALMHVATPQSVGHLTPLHKHPDVLVSRTSQAVVNQIQRRQ